MAARKKSRKKIARKKAAAKAPGRKKAGSKKAGRKKAARSKKVARKKVAGRKKAAPTRTSGGRKKAVRKVRRSAVGNAGSVAPAKRRRVIARPAREAINEPAGPTADPGPAPVDPMRAALAERRKSLLD